MGLPVTVYRYTDPGAPQLVNATPSEWINILKKVLVEGYGNKAPLGWTLEFENAAAFKVAFRNSLANGGSGGYFQFWSANGGNTSQQGCYIKCAGDMSAIDVFSKACGLRAATLSNSGKGWEIIGTSRGFYLMQHRTDSPKMLVAANTIFWCYFIGDIHSFYSNDINCFSLISGNNTAGDLPSTPAGSVIGWTTTLSAQLYAVDGVNTSRMYSMTLPFVNTSSPGAPFLNDAEVSNLQHNFVMPYLEIAYNINDASGVPANISTSLPACRGTAPGMKVSSFVGYGNNNWPVDRIFDGITYILLRSVYNNKLWISTGDWYE
ncbi:hypothetical protein KFE26_13710 [Shewanella sp. M16]|uniref:hypothetical protein n=1 Tax=Shewanella sp. M16 TaxID=2830837 RepID=UPI001BB01822|nr:hypothetical protein [Shewanella sp. M16]MBS0043347.1 hypothetical protein [Shewanella sp. M16]QYW06235.1 virion-associated protein [Shewanella phage vB_SspS_MuM16-1]